MSRLNLKKTKKYEKFKLHKITINNCELCNFTSHDINYYLPDGKILKIPQSTVEARVAYTEELDHYYADIIQVDRRVGNRLIFYYKNHPVSYQSVESQLGTALPIVSNICLSKAILVLGRAVAPGTKVLGDKKKDDNGNKIKSVLGTKCFIVS